MIPNLTKIIVMRNSNFKLSQLGKHSAEIEQSKKNLTIKGKGTNARLHERLLSN